MAVIQNDRVSSQSVRMIIVFNGKNSSGLVYIKGSSYRSPRWHRTQLELTIILLSSCSFRHLLLLTQEAKDNACELFRLLDWRVIRLPNTATFDGFIGTLREACVRYKRVTGMLFVWICPYLTFLCFFEPGDPYLRLFYAPALAIAFGIALSIVGRRVQSITARSRLIYDEPDAIHNVLKSRVVAQ